MANKKRIALYATVFFVFVTGWIVYLNSFQHQTQDQAQQRARQAIAEEAERIQTVLENQAYRMRLLSYAQNDPMWDGDGFDDQDGGTYVLLDGTGTPMRRDAPITALSREEISAALNGRAFGLINTDYGIILIVPADALNQYYLAKLWPTAAFDKIIAEPHGDNRMRLYFYGAGIESEGITDSSLPLRIPDTDILTAGGLLDYFGFVSLAELPGWSIGYYFSGETLAPEYFAALPGLMVVAALSFIVLAVCMYFGIEQHRRGVRIRESSHIDLLTGLHNEAGLEHALTQFFRRAALKDYSLIMMDMVGFHRFNTMFGHAKGDALLRCVAATIHQYYDCGARINGDLFIFLALSTEDMIPRVESMIKNGINNEMGAQYTQIISFKYGVYPLLEEALSYREAYDGVFLALRNAKSMSKTREVFYDRKMHTVTQTNRNIEMNMLRALAKEEFVVYVQPKFRTDSVQFCGGEALIRWQSEQLGFLSPFQFVPLFEQNGFIVELDFYILTHVLRVMQKNRDEGRKLYPISVNQSRISISFPSYLSRLKALVEQFTVPLHYVEIEITESALTENDEVVVKLVDNLRDLGFTVSMDDFGTGYSSLNTLRELSVDILKIDKGFLRESDTSVKGRKIIQSVINMSKELNIGTVCEGVETGMQLDFLRYAGCDIVQGYFLSKPMPYEEYERRYSQAGAKIMFG